MKDYEIKAELSVISLMVFKKFCCLAIDKVSSAFAEFYVRILILKVLRNPLQRPQDGDFIYFSDI